MHSVFKDTLTSRQAPCLMNSLWLLAGVHGDNWTRWVSLQLWLVNLSLSVDRRETRRSCSFSERRYGPFWIMKKKLMLNRSLHVCQHCVCSQCARKSCGNVYQTVKVTQTHTCTLHRYVSLFVFSKIFCFVFYSAQCQQCNKPPEESGGAAVWGHQ